MNRMQNSEYEQILLGSILIDPRILDENRITGDLFVEPACLAVFRCIEEAEAAKAPVNIREIGLRSGNPLFVAGLTDQTCSAANAEFYLKTLSELAQRRALMRVLRGTIEGLLEGKQWDEVFGGLSREITSLSLTGLRNPYSHISREMPNFIARLEEKYLLKGALSGLPSGFSSLDSMTNGFQAGEMIIIGARPSTGKTSIMLNLASAILRKGKTVGIFSAEMDSSQLIERMVSDWGSIDSTRLRSGLLSREDSARISCACTELAAKKLFLNDTPNVSLQDIECSGRAMRITEKADILMVDYLSLVTNDRKDIPRHEQMAEVSRRLKGLARNLGIPIVVLSQLTRDSEGVRPSLSKLRESGALEQDADIVILLNRMEAESSSVRVELLVEKNRNGPTGKVETIFAPSMMRFREIQAKDLGLEGGATAARYPHGKKSA